MSFILLFFSTTELVSPFEVEMYFAQKNMESLVDQGRSCEITPANGPGAKGL